MPPARPWKAAQHPNQAEADDTGKTIRTDVRSRDGSCRCRSCLAGNSGTTEFRGRRIPVDDFEPKAMTLLDEISHGLEADLEFVDLVGRERLRIGMAVVGHHLRAARRVERACDARSHPRVINSANGLSPLARSSGDWGNWSEPQFGSRFGVMVSMHVSAAPGS